MTFLFSEIEPFNLYYKYSMSFLFSCRYTTKKKKKKKCYLATFKKEIIAPLILVIGLNYKSLSMVYINMNLEIPVVGLIYKLIPGVKFR
jgi:hypothetical protein